MLIADENDDIFIDSQESHDESIITKIIRWITYVLLGAAICLLPFGMLRSCSSRKTQETQITQTTTNQQESYANLKILNLKKHGNNYRIVSSSDNPDKVLYKDSQDNFYDSETGLYMWYFKDYDVWQYWYEPISGNFGEYGWMEHYDDGWWIEASANNWIQVPSNYDISKLWYIE